MTSTSAMPNELNVTPVDSSHRLLNVLSHGAIFLGAPLLVPLIVYLVAKNDKTTVAQHAAEAFNFHLSYTVWALLCIPLVFIGIGALLLAAIAVTTFVCAIIAIVKASNDEVYRYPLTFRLLGN